MKKPLIYRPTFKLYSNGVTLNTEIWLEIKRKNEMECKLRIDEQSTSEALSRFSYSLDAR
jgi:hypothetical protein